MKTYDRILILQTAFLGDVVLTLPLVEAVHSLWPKAEIDFVVKSSYVDFLSEHKRLTRAIPFDKRGQQGGMKGLITLATSLRTRKYELALIPHRSFRSGLLSKAAGIPERIGFKRVAGSMWYTTTVTRDLELHESSRNLALLKPFIDGEDVDWDVRPNLDLDGTNAVVEVEEWMDMVGFPRGKRIVALAPGSVWATKRWPKSHWSDLLAKLVADSTVVPVLIGGPEDRELCLNARDVFSGSTYVSAGDLSVQGSAALIDRAELLVTGDTAPLHLAQAVRTPTLAIFGPTVPEFGFAPTGEIDRIVGMELDCRPCAIHGSHKCPLGHHDCMRLLGADRVFAVVQEMLSESES